MSSYYSKPNNGNFIPIPKGPHNERVRKSAEGHAYQMKVHPSWLEKQMIELLDSWKVKYEFQKIIYIKSSGGFIKQYYIADFFLPKKNIIIEVDGKFHKEQAAFDEFRTKEIQKHYPKISVIRWNSIDFRSYNCLKTLKGIIGK